ncbi:UPF0716 protein FxsA [Cytobacillus eiseniae]|uniref:UPF0716 protein FxsA n=1 Tax=Cytobacillus eiseniae TaxID=762947 RepID=A0ABS4RMT5_9BACI|nr:FxsA family protein [Cytobacillus eiseniae]MBP2243107.1 UPF0716 protein FxsA [Cytobacillus eiseniae]
MRYILLLIILIPVAEVSVLLLSSHLIGLWPTIGFLLLTGVLGAYLAKKQGLEAVRKVQEQLRYGQMPGDAVLDGICILLGGILLLTPGFLSDIIGLLLLAPPTKILFKRMIMKGFKSWMDRNTFTVIR